MEISVLQILQWLLLLFAIILALGLILLLLILLVPVRYQIFGQAEKKKPVVKGRIRWFLGLLKVDFSLEEELKIKGSLLGKIFYQYDKNRIKKEESFGKKEEENPPSNEVFHYSKAVETAEEERIRGNNSLEDNKINSQELKKEKPSKGKTKKRKREKKTWEERKLFFFQSVKEKCSKIENVKDKIKYYAALLEQKEVKTAFFQAKKKIGIILKALLPGKWNITGEVGLKDPSLTGEMVGILAMLYPYTRSHITISPNFEEEKLELSFYFKGKLRAITILYQGLSFLLNKDCMRTVNLLLKKDHRKKNRKIRRQKDGRK